MIGSIYAWSMKGALFSKMMLMRSGYKQVSRHLRAPLLATQVLVHAISKSYTTSMREFN